MPQKIHEQIVNFFRRIGDGDVEIYNEFSLQHELGIHLRAALPGGFRLQFERPTSYFPIKTKEYIKKEIDITIFRPEEPPAVAMELKFPRNGQYPEQMYAACKDIMFLEQLADAGFKQCIFTMAVDDHLFYEGQLKSGIYSYFRNREPIHGTIVKPTGANDSFILIEGSYVISWENAGPRMRYCIIEPGNGDAFRT